MFLKVIACEIAFREICYLAGRSRNLLDLEFLTQGHHDMPAKGREEIQERIDNTPPGKYGAILLGYGLCSSILTGLRAPHTPLVIPRAHDCITFFLGSKERYQHCFHARPGTYYYTSGWLECRQRRGGDAALGQSPFLPAHSSFTLTEPYQSWVKKYGEEQAQYLFQVMSGWSEGYTHGTLIDFDFTKPLGLPAQVQAICKDRGWQFEELKGDLGLLQRWLDGDWNTSDFLIVQPNERVVPSNDEGIIAAEAVASDQ